jgi:hypothetical protein
MRRRRSATDGGDQWRGKRRWPAWRWRHTAEAAARTRGGDAHGEGGVKEGEGVLTGDSAGVGEDDGGRWQQAADGGARGMDETGLDLKRPTAAMERCGDGTSDG